MTESTVDPAAPNYSNDYFPFKNGPYDVFYPQGSPRIVKEPNWRNDDGTPPSSIYENCGSYKLPKKKNDCNARNASAARQWEANRQTAAGKLASDTTLAQSLATIAGPQMIEGEGIGTGTIIAVVVGVLALAGGGYWWYKKKQAAVV